MAFDAITVLWSIHSSISWGDQTVYWNVGLLDETDWMCTSTSASTHAPFKLKHTSTKCLRLQKSSFSFESRTV